MDGIHVVDSSRVANVPKEGVVADRLNPESRSAFERYRINEAMEFLHLIPREGRRPLYAEAREWARREGIHNGTDPMDSLLRFLLTRLPLPSFDAWRADVQLHGFEYAVRACSAPDAEERAQEVTVDSRTFQHYRKPWSAGLHMYRDGRGWRGFISFAPADHTVASAPVRTANIFVDSDPVAIRQRFRSYRENMLTGLLRSSLP